MAFGDRLLEADSKQTINKQTISEKEKKGNESFSYIANTRADSRLGSRRQTNKQTEFDPNSGVVIIGDDELWQEYSATLQD